MRQSIMVTDKAFPPKLVRCFGIIGLIIINEWYLSACASQKTKVRCFGIIGLIIINEWYLSACASQKTKGAEWFHKMISSSS